MSDKTQNLLRLAGNDEERSSVSCAKRHFADDAAARNFFLMLKPKLFSVNEWNKHSTISGFELFDENGRPLENEPFSQGAFLRLSLKGSGKYDWVKFTDFYDAADEIVISVKPTYDPTADQPDKESTSHFFTAESTNNFCLFRENESVSMYVIGLNEKQNTTETATTIEMIRNVATANIGSFLGIQTGEWTSFCKSFLDCEN